MIGKSEWNVTHRDMVEGEKKTMTLLSEKRKSTNRNFKKCESRDGVCLRMKRGWSKASKYRKQKSPEKIKTDEHFECRRDEVNRARPKRKATGKRKAMLKPITTKKENDFRQIGKIRKKRCERWGKAPMYKPTLKGDK